MRNDKRHGDRFYEWDGKNHWRLDGSYADTHGVEPADVPELLRGRTITDVTFEESTGDFPQGNDLTLRLDDGTVVRVSGWGYDSCGTDVFQVVATTDCEDDQHAWEGKRCVAPEKRSDGSEYRKLKKEMAEREKAFEAKLAERDPDYGYHTFRFSTSFEP